MPTNKKMKLIRVWVIERGDGTIVLDGGLPMLFANRLEAFDACNINGETDEKPLCMEIRPIKSRKRINNG